MKIASLALIFLAVIVLLIPGITIDPIQAETGKGTDIFKVIMTIFGADDRKGDVLGLVAVNEASKVKVFDVSGPVAIPLDSSQGRGGNLIEYVATFPNVTVNAGDEYKACAMLLKDLELICETGHNSPAKRPEFVDISLNASDGTSEETATATLEGEEDEEDEGEEEEGED